MYKLKEIPEDFIVKEKSNVSFGESGEYSYYLMKKKDYTTLKAIEILAQSARKNVKDFGFAGTKDRRAVTEQMISVKGNVNLKSVGEIQVEFIGKGDTPISLGDLEGNYFEISVRNIDSAPKPKHKFINFFGEQRFSSQNIDIGRAIVKKDFAKACELVGLTVQSGDYVGALRKIHKKILTIYVHAYQSWIWNETVKAYNTEENEKIPILGFGTELEENKVGKIIESLMEKEEITERDFIIKQIPELTSEGDERFMFVEAKDLEIENLEDDDLNKGKKKIRIKFFLSKGCYATEFIRQLFQEQ